jgi:hypothetical protein
VIRWGLWSAIAASLLVTVVIGRIAKKALSEVERAAKDEVPGP